MITFSDLQKRLESLLSVSAASVLLVEVGRECGVRSCVRIKEKYGIEGVELLAAITKLKREEAWGEFDFKGIDPEQKRGHVIVRECFEAKEYGRSTLPVCHFVKGYLQGVLSTVLKQGVILEEVLCLAKGDAHCEFRTRSIM